MLLLVLPIAMILLFGFGITTEIKNTRFAVFDLSHDQATRGIVNKLQTSEYFTLEGYLDRPDQIEGIFKRGKIGMLVILGERFHENQLHTGDAQIQLITDGTDPNTASTLTNYATNLIREYQQESGATGQFPIQIQPERGEEERGREGERGRIGRQEEKRKEGRM